MLGVFVSAIALVPMLLVLGAVLTWKWLDRRRKRRSPLTSELLRPPAYSLTERLEDLRWDLASMLLGSALVPTVLLCLYLLQVTIGRTPSVLVCGVTVLLSLTFFVWRSVYLVKQIRAYRDGRDGEWATAQLLEPIIAGGGQVLHDIQGPGFNIDHVVIAPGGVFSIETKHRLKPTTGRGKENAKVSFDGKALRFPDWTDTTTADQAAAQARWLSSRLTRSTGLSVDARPVIALPGWFVDNTRDCQVWAMNPKNCGFMLKPRRGQPPLTKADIQRTSFQVEQLCKLPDPKARPSKNG